VLDLVRTPGALDARPAAGLDADGGRARRDPCAPARGPEAVREARDAAGTVEGGPGRLGG